MTVFQSFLSGSSGNCYYIGNNDIAILIDMGVSLRTLKAISLQSKFSLTNIAAILVTHDHMDHIKHLGTVAKKLSVPVFATAKLHTALETHPCTVNCLTGCRRSILKDQVMEHRGIKFTAFEVPHDATQTLGYFLDFFGEKFVFLTDIGSVSQEVIDYCKKANHLIIEANYDREMLIKGPYMTDLKNRIMSGYGHLSNSECADTLKKAYHSELKSIYLCHISDNNNTPSLAYDSAFQALNSLGLKIGGDIQLHCLPRKEKSAIFAINS